MAIDLPRRAFIFGLGASLVAQPKLLLSRMPIIHGDGLHDDWEGLQALFDGKPVKLPDGASFAPGPNPILSGGRYLIGRTLELGRGGRFAMRDLEIDHRGGEGHAIYCGDRSSGRLERVCVKFGGPGTGLAAFVGRVEVLV